MLAKFADDLRYTDQVRAEPALARLLEDDSEAVRKMAGDVIAEFREDDG